MKHLSLRPVERLVCLLAITALTGCGTHKFQQELHTEEAAIKLTHETIDGQYDLISTPELKDLLDSGQQLVLVDAMPAAASFDKGHLAGAINFEFPKEVIDQWNQATMGNLTQEEYESLLGEDKEQQIVVYCGFVKCARSHNAAVFARQLGYTHVKRYPGGIHAWLGAGHPLKKN